MDQVVQQAAAQTEELSSTAQSLASQAEQLQHLVTRFKLDHALAGLPPSGLVIPANMPAGHEIGTETSRRGPHKSVPSLAGAPTGNSSGPAIDNDFEEF
jgi:methyl-accepting chemotaxis protein